MMLMPSRKPKASVKLLKRLFGLLHTSSRYDACIR